jgi:hypothetical protein
VPSQQIRGTVSSGGTYPLVGEDVRPEFPLFTLNKLNVGFHTCLGKILCEEVRDVRIGVEASELVDEFLRQLMKSGLYNRQRTVMNCQTKPSLPNAQT